MIDMFIDHATNLIPCKCTKEWMNKIVKQIA